MLAIENPPVPTVIPAMSVLIPLFCPNKVLDTPMDKVSGDVRLKSAATDTGPIVVVNHNADVARKRIIY